MQHLGQRLRITFAVLVAYLSAADGTANATAPDKIVRLLFEGPHFIEIRSPEDLDKLVAQLLAVAANNDATIVQGLQLAQAQMDAKVVNDPHNLRAWNWNFLLLLRVMFESERGPFRSWKIPTERLYPTEAFAKKLGSPDVEVEFSLPVRVDESGRVEIVMYHSGNFTGTPARWDLVREFMWACEHLPRRTIDWEKQGLPFEKTAPKQVAASR